MIISCVAAWVFWPTTALGQPCQPFWSEGEFVLPGVAGGVSDMLLWDDGDGPALFIAGAFDVAGDQTVRNVARWDGTRWAALGEGVEGTRAGAECLAVFDDGSGPALYVGGYFTLAGGQPANYIAKWDGESWAPLGEGLGLTPFAMATYDDGNGLALYVGGVFPTAGGQPISRLAKWDGTRWSSVGDAFTSTPFVDVNVLAVHDDGAGERLFVGGEFSEVGGVPASHVAAWDGQSWAAVGGGLNREVSALAEFDDGAGPELYAGMSYPLFPDSPLQRWDGQQWTDLAELTHGEIEALTVSGAPGSEALYVGGNFSKATPDGGIRNIAKWDGQTLARLAWGTHSNVSSMSPHPMDPGLLVVGGRFNAVDGRFPEDGIGVAGMAIWGPAGWSPVSGGLAAAARAFEMMDRGGATGIVIAHDRPEGGSFDGAVQWLSDGVGTEVGRFDNQVFALEVVGEGAEAVLYAGGDFSMVDGVVAPRIAQWDGQAWARVGSLALDTVRDLLLYDDGSGPALYVASDNSDPGGGIHRWTGSQWQTVGGGVDGIVSALAAFDDGTGTALYAAGEFTRAGTTDATNIARWNGTAWSALPRGVRPVGDLAVFDDGTGAALYAAGTLDLLGGPTSVGISKFDGLAWGPVDEGLSSSVYAIEAFDDGRGPALYAGGVDFRSNLLRWDGTRWEDFGGPVDGRVFALAAVDDGSTRSLLVGGDFAHIDDVASAGMARWHCATSCTADLDDDGRLTIFDFLVFLNLFDSGDPIADFDGDGRLTIFDFLEFQNAFDAGC